MPEGVVASQPVTEGPLMADGPPGCSVCCDTPAAAVGMGSEANASEAAAPVASLGREGKKEALVSNGEKEARSANGAAADAHGSVAAGDVVAEQM